MVQMAMIGLYTRAMSVAMMAEIEGPEFRPTGDTMFNMDYISHGDSPLTPESWYYQQWESSRVFDSGGSLANIPHLEINITLSLIHI